MIFVNVHLLPSCCCCLSVIESTPSPPTIAANDRDYLIHPDTCLTSAPTPGPATTDALTEDLLRTAILNKKQELDAEDELKKSQQEKAKLQHEPIVRVRQEETQPERKYEGVRVKTVPSVVDEQQEIDPSQQMMNETTSPSSTVDVNQPFLSMSHGPPGHSDLRSRIIARHQEMDM